MYFAWPRQFRAIVNSLSPISASSALSSDPALREYPAPGVADLIAEAEASSPDRQLWGILFPLTETATYQITTAKINGRDEWGNTDHLDFYFDQYTGKLIEARPRLNRTAGDALVSWMMPAHFGTFGGIGIKILWLIAGLAPCLLFVTGSIMWWRRAVSGRRAQNKADDEMV
jgi:uncharacterized iron-regulated membrane protein